MFDRYESEQARKERELAKNNPGKQAATARYAGAAGAGRAAGHSGARTYTVYMPLNTMWIRFRASTGTNNIPDPRLTDIDLKVADLDMLEPALQQARNVLMITHKGIEDFSFRTQENQIESIKPKSATRA